MADEVRKIDEEDTPRAITDIESRGGESPPPGPASEEDDDVPRTITDVESRSSGSSQPGQADDEEADTPRG